MNEDTNKIDTVKKEGTTKAKKVNEKNKELDISKLNVHQRILGVMEDVRYLQKTEKAAKGLPYTFVTHDQVTGELHQAFVKWRLINICSVKSFRQDGNRTEVVLTVSFVNVDEPKDMITIETFGYGIDTQDKGVGKAISYAFKYACLKQFLLETGADVESDNIDFKEDKEAKGERHSIEQQRELVQLLDKLNDPYFENMILERNKISNLSELTKEASTKVAYWLRQQQNVRSK